MKPPKVLRTLDRQNYRSDVYYIHQIGDMLKERLSSYPCVERVYTHFDGKFNPFGSLTDDAVTINVSIRLNDNFHDSVTQCPQNVMYAYHFNKHDERLQENVYKLEKPNNANGCPKETAQAMKRDRPDKTRYVTFRKNITQQMLE